MDAFHKLHVDAEPPSRFTWPFCYEPHPLCIAAAREVSSHIEADDALSREAAKGKMFGVLVAHDGYGSTGFVAAYSGLLGGRNDWDYFVPPVFDSQRSGGYFKVRERDITGVSQEINALEQSPEYTSLLRERERMSQEDERAVKAFRLRMSAAKAARAQRRQSPGGVSEEEMAAMERESQFMSAELRRIKKRLRDSEAEAERRLRSYTSRIDELKSLRKSMSDKLQRWLFGQYKLLNANGERRDLLSIFTDTAAGTPPSGAGDCCAPKMLQYAYEHALHPVCMAEFWWGASPRTEIRHQGRFYPACSGKCKPILAHMMQGLNVEDDPQMLLPATGDIEVVYDDDWLCVVNKPAGMLSVPGSGSPMLARNSMSVQSIMRRKFPSATGPVIVHRLDMSASGIMIVAKSAAVHACLQAMFTRREIRKRYVALLERKLAATEGVISLPLSPDIMNRPMQKVDVEHGKRAVTEYRVTGQTSGYTRVELYPLTGRTHQLRVHCASPMGLNAPIAGDELYGSRDFRGRTGRPGRLYLHAEAIIFTHPALNKRMELTAKAMF